MPLRLLVINNILTPYNLSFFTAVGRQPDVRARTVLLAARDSNREWNVSRDGLEFDYRVLPSLNGYVRRIEMPLYLHWGLWGEMRTFRPDVVAICGYHYVASLEVLLRSHLRGVPTVLWSGSHLLSGFVKRPWADAYKRWVITRFDAYMTYGTAARDQLVHYGADPARIVVGCNTVDVRWFKERTDALAPMRDASAAVRLVYVGRLVAIKNVDGLIRAVGTLQREGLEVSLALVGDGPDREVLEALVGELRVRDVAFRGFRSGDDLVREYADADVAVLPSWNEPWGLVVNEAAACAIPSVVSTRAGAAADLVREGETGLTFDPDERGALEKAIRSLVVDADARRRMGRAAQAFILTRDPDFYAARLVEAARLARQLRGR